ESAREADQTRSVPRAHHQARLQEHSPHAFTIIYRPSLSESRRLIDLDDGIEAQAVADAVSYFGNFHKQRSVVTRSRLRMPPRRFFLMADFGRCRRLPCPDQAVDRDELRKLGFLHAVGS